MTSLSFFVICLIAVPLLSAIGVALLGGRTDAARKAALGSTLLTLALTVIVCWDFAAGRLSVPDREVRAVERFAPQSSTNVELLRLGPDTTVNFHIGLDGLNVWLVALTAVLMVSSVLVSWTAISTRANEFYAWLLVLQTAMVGVFLSFDVVVFYVFFELTLVPLFFLIGIWGGSQRQYAAKKFFIYTLTGSLITLVGVFGVVLALPHFEQATATLQNTQFSAFTKPALEVKGPTFDIGTLIERSRAVKTRLAELEEKSHSDPPAPAGTDGQAREVRAQAVADLRTEFGNLQFWVFLAMMVGFAIKVPLFPVHTWLPLAHVEAPTAGSVLLAGVLLKLGTYGFLRLCLPLTPEASQQVGSIWLGSLAVVGIIYGAFCALQQDDIKKLVAYSSVSHLGYSMLGLFALNETGITGSLLQMVNHGLSTGALFLLVGLLYERYHTRKLEAYSGMASRLKLLALAMLFITMSSIGLPGLNGFVGEVLVLMGMYGSPVEWVVDLNTNWLPDALSFLRFSLLRFTMNGRWLAVLGASGVVLGAWYMLSMVRKVFFGPLQEPPHEGHAVHDLNGRELASLLPVALLCLLIGLAPMPLIKTAAPEIKYIVKLTAGG